MQSASTSSPAATVTASDTSSAADQLSALEPLFGTYTATIPEGEENAPPGDWQLTIAADGLEFRHPDGHTFPPGAVVAVSANEITFGADPACPGQTTPTEGRYSWVVAATTLTFVEVEDSCRDRAGTLTTAPWTRTGA